MLTPRNHGRWNTKKGRAVLAKLVEMRSQNRLDLAMLSNLGDIPLTIPVHVCRPLKNRSSLHDIETFKKQPRLPDRPSTASILRIIILREVQLTGHSMNFDVRKELIRCKSLAPATALYYLSCQDNKLFPNLLGAGTEWLNLWVNRPNTKI